jgi:hypothetical protein
VHPDRLVDHPGKAPHASLIARHEPQCDGDEAGDHDERDDDEFDHREHSGAVGRRSAGLLRMLAPPSVDAGRASHADPGRTLPPRRGSAQRYFGLALGVRAAQIEPGEAEQDETDHDEDAEERVDLAGA